MIGGHQLVEIETDMGRNLCLAKEFHGPAVHIVALTEQQEGNVCKSLELGSGCVCLQMFAGNDFLLGKRPFLLYGKGPGHSQHDPVRKEGQGFEFFGVAFAAVDDKVNVALLEAGK